MKHAQQRELAQQDISKAFDYYLSSAGSTTAIDFVSAIEVCMQQIAQYPQAGSPRYAHLLDIEGLRFAVVTRFPYLVFYFERPDCVDVVRVLHQHQDIPNILVEQASS